MRLYKKLDVLALLTFFISVLTGVASHLLIFLRSPKISIRQYHSLSLGLGYDIMNAAMLAVISMTLFVFLNTKGRRLMYGLAVFAYSSFVFLDYLYVKQFGTHLPFSTLEYLGQASTFSSSMGASLMNKGVIFIIIMPMLLYYILSKRALERKGIKVRELLSRVSVTLVLLILIGGIAGSYSNSYLNKNINNPLMSSGIFYFYSTRNIEKEEIVEKPVAALEVVLSSLQGVVPPGQKFTKFPLVRTQVPTTCTHPDEQTGIGIALCGARKPNILFVMLESFRASDMGAYGSKLNLTPNFDELSQQGIFFKNFYANGFQTRHGQVASYCSLMPNYGAAIMKRYARNSFYCLPNLLKTIGYNTSWLFAADAAFDDQINFLKKIGIDRIIDRFSFDSDSERLGWGYSDQVLFDKWATVLDKAKEPFFSTALTITNHHPFDVPKEYKIYQDADDTEKYHEAVFYTDSMLGNFISHIKSKPWYSNSLVFIFADTSNYQNSQEPPSNFEEFVKLRSRIPLLILGGLVNKKLVVEDYYSQIDLAPSLMDLIGIEYTTHWAGGSMLSTNYPAIAYTNRPGNYWAVMSQKGRYYREADTNNHFFGMTEEKTKRKYRTLGKSWIKATKWLLQNDRYWKESFQPCWDKTQLEILNVLRDQHRYQ